MQKLIAEQIFKTENTGKGRQLHIEQQNTEQKKIPRLKKKLTGGSS